MDWIDERYDIMALFVELLFHLLRGMMYCAFENGIGMFTSIDFNIKKHTPATRDCQHMH